MSAIHEVMTSVEIEMDYGMKASAVRQYMKNHKELIAQGVARKAGERTWIILKSEVRKIWGEPPIIRGSNA